VLSLLAFTAVSSGRTVMILILLESVESQLSDDIVCAHCMKYKILLLELCAKCVSSLSLSADSEAWR